MGERLRFVARLLEGEAMTDVCREFGISRKTGYKIFSRYKEEGLDALSDRSRRPVRYANQLPGQVERLIVDLKRDKPHWGARKIRELLVRRECQDFCVSDFCEGGFAVWYIESETSTARLSTLLGRTERSSPEAAQRCAAGAGLDGESASQAIIAVAVMLDVIIVLSPGNGRRSGWQTGPWRRSIRSPAASASRRS
jgi:transposase-like protein